MSDATATPRTSARRGWLRRKFWRTRMTAYRNVVGLPTARWRALPDLMVIGAQRSGTTSLYRHLSGHPNVRWPLFVKSPHWLDAHHERSRRWYRAHFPLTRQLRGDPVQLTGEASPYFLFHPAVPARIAEHVPEARLVAILRDPVSRAWSQFQHEQARGYEDLDFRAALDAEQDRIAPELPHLAEPGYVGYHHRHHAYVARGLYADQIRRYHEVLDPSQMLVVLTDDLQAAPQDTFDRVCDFVGLPRHELEQAPRHHARSYSAMPDDVRQELVERFREPNRELAELLGRDLPWESS